MLEIKYVLTAAFVCSVLSSIHFMAAILLEERRFSKKKTAFLWLTAGVILFLSVFLCYSFLSHPLRLVVSLLAGFLYFWGTFLHSSADGLWKKCYLWVTYGTFFCILWPISVTISKLIVPATGEILSYLVRSLLQFLLCLPILLFYRKYIRELIKDVSGFHSKSWFRLFVFSVIYLILFIFFMVTIVTLETVNMCLVILYVISICGYVSSIAICISTIYSMRKEERAELVKENMEYMVSYVESVRKMEEETRRLRHDIRHHNERIASLAREGNTRGILQYLGENEENKERKMYCPNICVNGILSSYADKMEEKGITFIAAADTPRSSIIRDVDYVSILSNLLENAFNAVLKMNSNGPVRVNIKRVGEKSVIVVSNPSPYIKIEGGLPLKRSTGIDSVITSARKYDGLVDYTFEDGYLTSSVVLNLCLSHGDTYEEKKRSSLNSDNSSHFYRVQE